MGVSRTMSLPKVHKKINREMGKAIMQFPMIADGDRILLALSGGKDSLTLLDFLLQYQKKAPVKFEVIPVHVQRNPDPGSLETLRQSTRAMGAECVIEPSSIADLLQQKLQGGELACSLCSRLRRGALYGAARRLGCNKIALGHHRDDLLETYFLNLFFSGKAASMSPIYRIQEGDLTVIRPLYMVKEEWIIEYVSAIGIQVLDCSFCEPGGEEQRKEVRKILDTMDGRRPGIKDSIFAAMANPHLEELPVPALWKNPHFSEPG